MILIAQDLTYYGLDIYKKRNLSELMSRLAEIEGIDWIRLQYAYPSGFPMDILDAMNENDNVCKYLDMPLQHASSSMLKSMKRGINREKTDALIKSIREKVPGIALRTTLITGFPGETEADFQEMMEWIKETRFERLGCFTYSHEENTSAHDLVDDVPQEVKQDRANQIMALQSGISMELNQAKVGKTYKVLFDRVEGDYFIGRTQYDSPEVDNEVLVHNKDGFARIGDFANVEVTDAEEFDLFGTIV